MRESPSYAALVTSIDGAIGIVLLGSAAIVEHAVEDWRQEASGRAIASGVASTTAEADYRLAGTRLRRVASSGTH